MISLSITGDLAKGVPGYQSQDEYNNDDPDKQSIFDDDHFGSPSTLAIR